MSDHMTVAALSVTPVKGLALHRPESLEITRAGVVGNRAFFLIDDAGGIVSCTEVGDLMQWTADYDESAGRLALQGPDGDEQVGNVEVGPSVAIDFYGMRTVTGRVAVGWGELFSEIVGRPVQLVRGDTEGHDIGPVTLVGTASMAALGALTSTGDFDARRFRMNVEIAGAAPLAEDAWRGRRLTIGPVVLEAGGPVKRCAATTRNPDSGVVDLKTLALIGELKGRETTEEFGAGFYLGVYAEVVEPGRVTLGDPVTLLDA